MKIVTNSSFRVELSTLDVETAIKDYVEKQMKITLPKNVEISNDPAYQNILPEVIVRWTET